MGSAMGMLFVVVMQSRHGSARGCCCGTVQWWGEAERARYDARITRGVATGGVGALKGRLAANRAALLFMRSRCPMTARLQ